MRTRERRQEVIKRDLVGHIYGGDLKAPLISLTVEEIVIAHGNVEEVPRGDARRVVVVTLCSGRAGTEPGVVRFGAPAQKPLALIGVPRGFAALGGVACTDPQNSPAW